MPFFQPVRHCRNADSLKLRQPSSLLFEYYSLCILLVKRCKKDTPREISPAWRFDWTANQ
jgi:hypothetical protein